MGPLLPRSIQPPLAVSGKCRSYSQCGQFCGVMPWLAAPSTSRLIWSAVNIAGPLPRQVRIVSEAPQSQIPIPDLKLEACALFANEPTPTFASFNLKTRSLTGPFAAFLYNILRLKSLMIAPSRIGYYMSYLTNLLARAELEKTGRVSEYDDAQQLPDVSSRFTELFMEEIKKRRALAGTSAAAERRVKIILDMTNIMHFFAAVDSDFKTSLEAMLASYITGMWTAFETLAGDLWERALNVSPENLATLQGVPRGQQRKSIDLDIIKLHGFDLQQKMGTILRGKYEMSGLSEIRRAYAHAFVVDADAIIAAINDPVLEKLSAVRNLIVHKAGIVDQEYLERTKHFGDLPPAMLLIHLPIDGQFVSGLLRSSTAVSFTLLKSVDEWIDQHKNMTTQAPSGAVPEP